MRMRGFNPRATWQKPILRTRHAMCTLSKYYHYLLMEFTHAIFAIIAYFVPGASPALYRHDERKKGEDTHVCVPFFQTTLACIKYRWRQLHGHPGTHTRPHIHIMGCYFDGWIGFVESHNRVFLSTHSLRAWQLQKRACVLVGTELSYTERPTRIPKGE